MKIKHADYLQAIGIQLFIIVTVLFLSVNTSYAQITVSPATGGGSISADDYTSQTFTSLTGPTITETNPGQLKANNTIVFTAPSGFVWDTTGANPAVTITVAPGFNGNGGTKLTIAYVSRDSIHVTFQVTSESTVASKKAGQAVFSGLRIRPFTGIIHSGNIRNTGTTAPAGVTNYGTIGMVAGTPSAIRVEASGDGSSDRALSPQTLIAGNSITGYAIERDAEGNFISNIAADSWALTSITGGIATSDITPSTDLKSAVFSSDSVGTAIIQAIKSGLASVTSGTMSVNPAAASQMIIKTQPSSNVTAGQVFPIQPVIKIEDSYGNLETGDNSTSITVSLSQGKSSLQGTTSETASSGIATFTNLSYNLADTLILAFNGGGLPAVNSNSIIVSPATVSKLAFVQQPLNATKGNILTPPITVRLYDAYNNEVTSSGTPISISLGSGQGVVSGTTTQNTNATGLATFNDLKINNTGQKQFTASSSGLSSAVSDTFNIVSAGVLANFLIKKTDSTSIASVTAGQPFNSKIWAVDGNDKVVSGFTQPVKITSNVPLITGGGLTSNFTSGILSSHTLKINKTGSATITVSDTSKVIQSTSNTFQVLPNTYSLSQSTISVSDSAIVADGSSSSIITVQLKDSLGNNEITGGQTVTINSTGGTIGPVTDNGDGTYMATLTSAITLQTVTISVWVNGQSISSGDPTIRFKPGSVDHYLVYAAGSGSNSIGNQSAGTPFNIKIEAVDANNNIVSTDSEYVQITSNRTIVSGGGASNKFTNGVISSHSITINESGTGTYIAISNLSGTISSQSNTFTINPGAIDASTSTITASPDLVQNDGTSTSTITVQLKDGFGNNQVTGGAQVQISSTQGTISSTTDNNDGSYTAILTSTTTVQTATVSATYNNGSNSLIHNVSVTFTQFNTWLSAGQNKNASDWNLGSNWSLGIIPNTQEVAVIPTNPQNGTNFPQISSSTHIGNLLINSNASVTVSSGVTLTVDNQIEGSGTLVGDNATIYLAGDKTVTNFNAATSKIILNGSSTVNPQKIQGEMLTGNLTINNGAGVTADGYVFVADTLNIAANALTMSPPSGSNTKPTLEVLDIVGSGSLSISKGILKLGGIENLSNINVSTSEVVYNGLIHQTVNSNMASFYNLKIDNDHNVTAQGNITVNDTLKLTNGRLIMPSGSNLIADNKQIANGKLTFNRAIADSGWTMLSSPVNTTYGRLFHNIVTQGYPGATFPSDTTNPNILYYLESYPGTDNQRYRVPTDSSTVIPAGKGLFVYVFGQVPNDTKHNIPLPDTLVATGQENGYSQINNNFDFNVTYTAAADTGWNLVGNPFGATINWDSPYWVKTNMSNVIYIWDPAANNGNGLYRVWNGSVGNPDSSLTGGLIAPFQAFWVKADTTNPSLKILKGAKTVNGPFYKRSTNRVASIDFELTSGKLHTSAFVMFSDSARLGKDKWDAYRLIPLSDTYLELYTVWKKGTELSINDLPENLNGKTEIPMAVGGLTKGQPLSGNCELTWPKLNNLPKYWSFKLKDNIRDTTIDLKNTVSYSFTIPKRKMKKAPNSNKPGRSFHLTSTTSADNARFTLQIYPNTSNSQIPDKIELNQNFPNPFNPTTTIRFALPKSEQVKIVVYNILGQRVATITNKKYQAGYHEVVWDAHRVASGLYFYRMVTGGNYFTKKMIVLK
ncbi:MAG TPA: invasin domain 3-containing protein [Balneolales bacterium]|nr:invasin domain 3-containing protein [Balneolales bacterium]